MALRAAGLAYIDFARQHVGHFRVMFQHALVDVHDEEEPVEGAETAYGILVELATGASNAGYGAGVGAEAMTHMCWSVVHGISVLLVEGVIARKQTLDAAAEQALALQTVDGLVAVLREACA